MKEYDLSKLDLSMDAIVEAMNLLGSSEDPVVFRGGEGFLDEAGWYKLLNLSCGFKPDKRHFDSDENQALRDWWEISYQPKYDSRYAHSKTRQPLHCDNAWFSDPAEINFCIMKKQAVSGGEQTIYPISRLIDDLMSFEPDLFHDLTNQVVRIIKGEEGVVEHKTMVISLSPEPRVCWNYYRTEKKDQAIKKMCDRFFAFLEKQESTSSVERLRCETGDCFAFNDKLILHGRTAFTAENAFDRIMIQSMWKV